MSNLVKMWKDPQYKVVIKLLLWGIFMTFVICLGIFLNHDKNAKDNESNINSYKIINVDNMNLNIKYQLNDYVIEGDFIDNVFKGNVTYENGTSYQIKYENGSLIKDDNNGDFLVISIETRYLDPNYISNLFNSNKPVILEENKSYLYSIDGVTYYLFIDENSSYKIRIIKDDNEGILEYKILQ